MTPPTATTTAFHAARVARTERAARATRTARARRIPVAPTRRVLGRTAVAVAVAFAVAFAVAVATFVLVTGLASLFPSDAAAAGAFAGTTIHSHRA